MPSSRAPSIADLRKDTGFAATDHRPTGPEYDRYINLVIKFRDNDYRADYLYDISPFRVTDIGFNAILQAGKPGSVLAARSHWRYRRRHRNLGDRTKDVRRYRAMLAGGGRFLLRCRYAHREADL